MNHIFSSLWNHSLGAWVAASEHTRRGRQRGGSASRSRGRKASAPQMTIGALQAAVLLACGWLLTAGTQATAQSLPQNGNIVSGSASINFNGNVMTIDQTSRAALINWSSFNIGAANTVQFNQLQGSQATAVNLVTGSSASLISGELTSIGQVFLINPAGITFNAGASVNVGGLLASTLSPGTPGLLNANGVASTFELAGGGTGAVVSNNGGTLSAASGGISLIGGAVSNIGIISAANGSINLVAAGAARVTNDVSSSGMSQLTFLPTAAGTFAGTGINNTGVLSARNISMNALMGPGLSSTGINTGGTIIANAIDAGEGSLTIRSTAPVAINAATITAETVAVAGVGASGPVAIQMTDGSIQAGTVAFDSGPSGNVMLGGDIKADTIGIAANNAVQTGGSLEGALSLATQGGVILGQSGNRIGSVGGSVGSDLTLATSTDLSNGGALSVGGSSVIEAGSANITLTNAGNSFGNGVSANGGDITLVSNGVLGLGNINARSLAAQAGSIDLSGTVTTTGDQTYQSAVTLRGNSALQGRAIQFNDTIDGSYRLAVDSSGMTTFSGAVGGSTALQALNVTSGTGTRLAGDITTSGAIDLQDNLLLGTNVALTSTGNQGITLGGSVDSTGGARSLTLTTNGLATLGGSVGGSSALSSLQRTGTGSTQLGGSITTTGDIVLQGGLQATGSTAISSTGNGRIDVGGSILANGGVALSGGDIIVGGDISAASAASVGIDGATFSGAGITSNGTLDINVRNGALLQNGAYLAGGTASFSVAGDIVLTNAQNQLGGTVSLHGEDVTLANQGNLRLGSVDAQTLQVNSTGSISQTNNTHLDVTGTSSFTSTGGISLLDTGNALAGAVSLSGGAAQITASGDLRFGALNVDSLIASADTVYLPQLLTTLGGQSYSGRLVLEGDTALSSTLGALAFTGTLEGPHALSLHASGTVSLGATADIGSLGSTATETQLAADLTTVGDISLANTRVVGDVALTSTAGSVQINGVVNGLQDNSDSLSIAADGQIALLGAVGNAERLHDLSLSAATVSTVAVDVGNRLAIDSTASINQGGRYGVGGTARFASGGDITLLNTANAFGGDVELIGNKVQIAAQGPLSLSGVDADVLHATAGGLLTVRNADVVSSTTLTGNAVALDGVALGLSAEVAALGGNITQQGSVRVDGPSSWSSSGNVLLGNAANQLDGAVTAQGNMVSLATDGTLDIASVQASGQANLRGEGVHLDSVQATGLQVDSSAGITQGSALNVGGSSRFSAAGDIALGHAGNQFGGSVALNGANVAIASASGLLLDTVQASGDLSVAAGNAGIRQNAALQVAGRSDFNTSGDMVLADAGNRFTGTVSLQAREATIHAQSPLALEDVNVAQLTADSAGRLSLARADVSGAAQLNGTSLHLDDSRIDGALTATARSGDISQGSGALTIGSHSVLTAAKDIALGNSSNQFGGDVYAQGDNIGLSASSALEIAQLQAAGNTRLAGHGVNLNNTSVGNDLQVDSSASITQGSALKVGGNSRFSAAGDITLDHAGNQFAGSLALIGGDVAISLADGRLLDAIQTSGNLSVTAGSTGIRQNAALQVAGRSDFNTSGDIVLTDAGNRFGGDVYAQGNNIRLGAGSALEIAQLQAAGNAQITGHGVRLRNTSVGNDLQVDSSAALTQGSALNVGGSSRFSAAGDIALSHAGNQLGGHVTLNGANVAIASANGLLLDTVQASGDLSVAAGSAGIRQNAAMQVAGRSDFNTSGDMVLADAGNRFTGTVSLQAREATIHAQSPLALEDVNVAQLTADSAGRLSLARADVSGAAQLDSTSLHLDDSRIDGALTATARSGDIRQGNGALAIGNHSQLAASNDIVLGNGSNQFGSNLHAQGRDIRLNSHAALDIAQLQATGSAQLAGHGVGLHNTSVGNDLQLDSSAAIHQGSALQVGGRSRFSAAGDIALDHAGNHFGGSVALAGSNVAIASDHAGLALAEVHAATLEAGSLGALSLANATVAGTTQLQGSSVALGRTDVGGAFTATATSTDITQTDRLSVGGNSQLQAANAITLDRAQNHFGGRVDLHAASAKLGTDGSLALGDVTADRLQASATQGLQLQGHIAATTVDLATAGAFDNQTGADAIRVGGNGRWHVYLDAPDQGHQFGGLDSGNTAVWNTQALGATSAAGNRYLFAWSPTLTVEGMALSKNLGTVLDISQAYTWSGLMPGVANAYRADSLTEVLGGNIRVTSAGAAGDAAVQSTPYRIDLDASHLDLSQSGYQLVLRPGELRITSTQDSAAYQSAIRLPATAVAEQPLPPTASYVARIAGGMQRPTSRCTALTTDCVEE